MLTSILGDM